MLYRFFFLLSLLAVLSGCKEMLQDQLSSRDAAEMVLVLQNSGISVERRSGLNNTYELWVEEADTVRALQILQKAGLPKEDFESLNQIFPGDGFIQTPMEQQARFMHAMNQELSRTISEIEGITAARVHVVTPDKTGSSRIRTKASASVAVHHLSTMDTNLLADRVRIIVANAVPDLNFRDVSLAFFPVNLDGNSANGIQNAQRFAASTQSGLSPMRLLAVILGLAGLGYGAYLYAKDRRWII